MDWEDDIHVRCTELRRRSAQLRAEAAALQEDSAHLVEQRDAWRHMSGGRIYDAPLGPHEAAMEALRLIRTIVDPFPIGWQVAIVKALAARTIAVAHEQIRPSIISAITA